MILRRIAAIALGLCCAALWAQESAPNHPLLVTPPSATGTVTGKVTASDTQRSARFVRVALVLKKPVSTNDDDDENKAAQTELVNGRSGLDGTFTIANVPEGDYYLFGVMSGYLQPYKRIENDDEDDDKHLAKAMADVPVVHVSADRITTKDITIVRGATISGSVLYDDGTPATDLRVTLEATSGVDLSDSGLPTSLMIATRQGDTTLTDDRGHFRATGLAPGKYRVVAHVLAEDEFQWIPPTAATNQIAINQSFTQELTIYAPGKFRKSEAQVIEVRGDEEVVDVVIKVALDSTRAVSGFVYAKEDHHAPNHSIVRLIDPTGEFSSRLVRVNAQGEFHFSYVPQGTYELVVQGMDSVWRADPHRAAGQGWMIATNYEPIQLSVVVSDKDVKVDDVLVTARKPPPPRDSAPQ